MAFGEKVMSKKVDTASKGKMWLIGGIVVVILGGGALFAGLLTDPDVAALASGDSDQVVSALARMDQDKLASDADARKKARQTLRDGSREDMFKKMRDQELSDDERHRLMENMHTLMREEMTEKAEKFNKATPEEQVAMLDKDIDEMIARRAEWEKRREEWDKKREKDSDKDKDKEKERDGRRGPRQRTTQERKSQMEGGNPDQHAKMRKYFRALMARAKERGVSMGGPGGGRGRGGGGPRGGGR